MIANHPKVFVSHASEDKERFVLKFATKLRECGIDAWVDRWEMLPGDSLVDKIFEEGIKNAQALIIVLSRFSVQKPWIREEMNAGMVRKINGKCKIIPVVIDDCEVPEALQSTLWQNITDLHNYDPEFERIVASIFGHTEKPPLGSLPKYTNLMIDNLPGLTRIDTLVVKTICEVSLKKGSKIVNPNDIISSLKEWDISQDEIFESIDILDEHLFIKVTRVLSGKILSIEITISGFERYASLFLPEFSKLINQVLISIANHKLMNNRILASHLNKSKILIDYMNSFRLFSQKKRKVQKNGR
jgi:hypothetical protein